MAMVVLMLGVTGLASADAPNEPCSEDALADSSFEFCETVTGPGNLQVKNVLSVGFAGGVATFPVGDWTGDRDVGINVRWDRGLCYAISAPPCGFTVLICNDRDLDGTCTNIGPSPPDELYETAASEGVLGDCKDVSKECDDPNEAGWTGCLNSNTSGGWDDGQLAVFIGVEVGPNLSPTDVQAALSAGAYSVWVDDGGSTTC